MKKSFKIEWHKAVDVDFYISTAIQMLILEWMFKTSCTYRQLAPYGRTGVFEVIAGLSCVNTDIERGAKIPIDNKQLREMIQRAVLMTNVNPCVQTWRNDYNVCYGQSRMITSNNFIKTEPFGMYDYSILDKLLETLNEFKGKRLNYSPNKYWPQDNYIRDIDFYANSQGLFCKIEYGVQPDENLIGGSSWELATIYKNNLDVSTWIKDIIIYLNSQIEKSFISIAEVIDYYLPNLKDEIDWSQDPTILGKELAQRALNRVTIKGELT